MINEIGPQQWVNDINAAIYASQDANQLLANMAMIFQFRHFLDVVPHCINAARYQAHQLGIEPGLTVVVDGESVMHTVGYATDSVDKLPEKVVQCLRKVERELNPMHFIVAFDSDDSYRHALSGMFKADRKVNERKVEIDASKGDVVKAAQDGMQVEIIGKREADDVLASVATQCQILGTDYIMVTEDRDCWQALGKNTSIYSLRKKTHCGAPWLLSAHQITPKQVVDWLCMVGKNGIKGVEGIGESTASTLLAAYGTYIDAMQQCAISENKKRALEAFDYWAARKIHTLDKGLRIGRAKYSTHDASGPGADRCDGRERCAGSVHQRQELNVSHRGPE